MGEGGASLEHSLCLLKATEAHMMISTSSEQQRQWMVGISRGRGERNKTQQTGQKRETGLELLIFHIFHIQIWMEPETTLQKTHTFQIDLVTLFYIRTKRYFNSITNKTIKSLLNDWTWLPVELECHEKTQHIGWGAYAVSRHSTQNGWVKKLQEFRSLLLIKLLQIIVVECGSV